MSLTSYRAALPRAIFVLLVVYVDRRDNAFLTRSGGDLLSHALRRSTIGAAALNGRVRDGIGCFARARATRPGKKRSASFCFRRTKLSKDAFWRSDLRRLLTAPILLLPDQIKPIEPLVPVN